MADATQTLDRLGPYRLLRELGAGGMGTVYLADDLDEGRQVALKVLHPHLVEREGFFKRFQREAQAGEQVDHPNVVRTLDSGFHMRDGKPHCVLAMEYVEGQTLRDLLQSLGTVPEGLLRETARQVAAGLEAIHQAGIVHRDIKPENILITEDHQIRIMDLGVARITEASTLLTREGQFAGSLLYAAPEQFLRGGSVGPAADLYALGVLLYELVAGVNPFRHDEPGAVLQAHLEVVPERLDRRTEETSPFLAQVIATLLRKVPTERFATAAVLGGVLKQGERSAWWAERERSLLAEQRYMPRVPVRRETKVYGREGDLEALRRAWDETRAGRGSSMLLMGEAGIGKSRLVAGLLDNLAEDSVHVLYGSHAPAGGNGGIAQALLRHFPQEGLETSLAPYMRVTPTLVPALAAWLRSEAPPEGAATLQGDALNAALVHLTQGLAKERPLLLVVEDLHFASAEELKILLSVARAVADHRALLLLTTRPDVDDSDVTLLGQLENHQRIDLARLGARDIILLLRDAFRNERLVEKLGPRIAEKSDGVPFFVFEMIEGLKEGQFIAQRPDGSWIDTKAIEAIEVPSSVKDLISARLRDLSDEDRAILDVGAVQGFEFDPALVAGVLDARRVTVLQRLASLERRSGLVRSTGELCRFDHHQIQELLYADLPDPLRAEYHTLLADAFAARPMLERADRSGADARFLAHHHLCGHEPGSALPLLDDALKHLRRMYRGEESLKLCDRALERGDLLVGEDRLRVLLEKAEVLYFVGQLEHVQGVMEQALRLARRVGDSASEARAARNLARLFFEQGRRDEWRKMLQLSLEVSRRARNPQAEGRALEGLALAANVGGRFGEAKVYAKQALTLARGVGDGGAECVCLMHLGQTQQCCGATEEAEQLFVTAREVAASCGERQLEARALELLARAKQGRRKGRDAIRSLKSALRAYSSIGERRGQADAICAIAGELEELGRYAAAHRFARRLLGLAHELGNPWLESGAVELLGILLVRFGRYCEARHHLEQLVRLSRMVGDRRMECNAVLRLGQLAVAEEEGPRSDQELSDAIEEYHSMGEDAFALAARLSRGVLRARLGDADAAAKDLNAVLEASKARSNPLGEVLALAHLATLPGHDAAQAIEVLEQHKPCIPPASVMHARFLIWQATGEMTHLAGARRLLGHCVDHAPKEYRESMLKNVRLHREIMEAWAEHGESAAE